MYIVADRGLNGLSFPTFHFNAGNGKNGGSKWNDFCFFCYFIIDYLSLFIVVYHCIVSRSIFCMFHC